MKVNMKVLMKVNNVQVELFRIFLKLFFICLDTQKIGSLFHSWHPAPSKAFEPYLVFLVR